MNRGRSTRGSRTQSRTKDTKSHGALGILRASVGGMCRRGGHIWKNRHRGSGYDAFDRDPRDSDGVVSLGSGDTPRETETASEYRYSCIFVYLFSGIAGAFSWLFYFLALKTGPVQGVAALDRLSVVFVFVLAVLFLGEPLGWKNALGAALLISGAVLMVWE